MRKSPIVNNPAKTTLEFGNYLDLNYSSPTEHLKIIHDFCKDMLGTRKVNKIITTREVNKIYNKNFWSDQGQATDLDDDAMVEIFINDYLVLDLLDLLNSQNIKGYWSCPPDEELKEETNKALPGSWFFQDSHLMFASERYASLDW